MWQNFRIAFSVCVSLSMGCTNNFETFANKTSDEAKIFDVREDIRKGRYSDAITTCAGMSATLSAQRDVKRLCATAYAGSCGFNFLTVVSNFDAWTGTPDLFLYLMTLVGNKTAANLTDCDTAETTLRSIGTAANRTSDENVFMLLLSLYKVSVALDVVGDTNDDDALDGGFDACTTINAANAQSIGSALWELDKSLDELASDPTYTDVDTAMDLHCTLLVAQGIDLCAASDPTALNATELDGARATIKEGAAFGVDQCGADTPVSAGCKCP